VHYKGAYDSLNSPFKKFLIIKIWHKYFALKSLKSPAPSLRYSDRAKWNKKKTQKTSWDVRLFIKAGRLHTVPAC